MPSRKQNDRIGQLRDRIQNEADPVGFMIMLSKGEPFQWGKENLHPTHKSIQEANAWLGDRLLPKLRDVAVEHNVGEGLAERIAKASGKDDVKVEEARKAAALEDKRGEVIDVTPTVIEDGEKPRTAADAAKEKLAAGALSAALMEGL